METAPINHECSGVYIDGRLLLVDATWMSTSYVRDDIRNVGKYIRFEYFDMPIDTFSIEHRIVMVEERKFEEMIYAKSNGLQVEKG